MNGNYPLALQAPRQNPAFPDNAVQPEPDAQHHSIPKATIAWPQWSSLLAVKPATAFLALALLIAPFASAAIDPAKLPPPAERPVDFVKDIRPIFEAACVKCHGPDRQKGGLRLDRRADALAGGDSFGPVIVAGKAVESPLLHSISGLDEDLQMPQKGDPLTAEQVGLIRAWIDQGAIWPDDGGTLAATDTRPWSFLPLTTPKVPQLPAEATCRARNDVDRFLLATLGDHQLTFSPEADARTLARRLHLTLTGLPPSPEAVAAFEAEHRRDPDLAVERLADRLLASPQFGERWAQHWLDVVRFAETNGSESNLYRVNAWPYRDYVIRAFNQDLPLDRFLREQIAGDALGVDEATGFLVAGMFVTADTVGREEQAIRQARADRLEETIQGVSASMLGVTMGCARCHNHKFDPIPQKDYYSLAAVFAGVEYGSRPWRTRPDAAVHEARAAGFAEQLAAARAPLRAAGATWTEDWPTVLQTFFPPVRARTLRFSFPAEFAGGVDEVELFGPATGTRNLALARGGAFARSHKQKEDEQRPVSALIDGIADRYHNWRAGRNPIRRRRPGSRSNCRRRN
jgi:mono/diheme cytochrome c family protein